MLAEGRRRLLGRDARREAILQAAAEAFAARGFAGTSMDDVASTCGVTRLIVYRHFPTKRDLYGAVLEKVARHLAQEFSAQVRPGRVAEGSVAAMVSVARDNPGGFALLWRHAMREPELSGYAEEIRARAVAQAEALLGNRVKLEGARRWAATTLVAFVVEAVLAWLELGRPEDDERLAKRLARSLPALVKAWEG